MNNGAKKHKHITIIINFFLCITMVLSTPLVVCADWYEERELVPSDIPYAQMTYEGFDSTTLLSTLDQMEALIHKDGQEDALLRCYETLVQELDFATTQKSLNSLRYYNDVNHPEYQQIDTEMTLLLTDLADQVGHTLHLVLSSPYGEEIADAMDSPRLVEYYLHYQDMTEEEKALAEQENYLIQCYDQESTREYTYCDSTGKSWTQAQLDAATDITAEQYLEINQGLSQAKNETLASIYLELVKNRNRQAQIRGYDNYATYAYQEIYGRDYSTQQAQQLYAYVKEDFAPILPTLYQDTIYLLDPTLFDMPELTPQEIIQDVGRQLRKIDPELLEAFQYMTKHQLYDLEASSTKMNIGYTDYLYSYHAPVIFHKPEQTYYDYGVLIHEFGHYNNAYHNNEHALTDSVNMDVAEIHSQGLELLFLAYGDKLFPKKGDSFRLLSLYNITSAVIDGCLFDEFQNLVYAADEELTIEQLNTWFYSLAKQYNFEEEMAKALSYSWVTVPHTFQSPLYYISYATSALSALDLFSTSLHNRKEGVRAYMNLTTYGLDTPYCALIAQCGLRDIFEKGTIDTIANDTLQYSYSVVKHASQAPLYRFLMWVALIIILLVAILTVLILLRVKKTTISMEKR